MSEVLIPVILSAGLAAVFNREESGLEADLTHMALGDGRYQPSKDQTSLQSEKLRIPIAGGSKLDPHQIHVTALADDPTLAFWVTEVGFVLSDGTFLAIWASEEPLAYKSKQVPLLLGYDLVLEALPADSINIICTQPELSLAVYTDKFISNAAATIATAAQVIKNAHWNLQLSEKIRLMEKKYDLRS